MPHFKVAQGWFMLAFLDVLRSWACSELFPSCFLRPRLRDGQGKSTTCRTLKCVGVVQQHGIVRTDSVMLL